MWYLLNMNFAPPPPSMQERFNGVAAELAGEQARRLNAAATEQQLRRNRERIIAPLAGILRQDAAEAARYLAQEGAQPQRRVNMYVKGQDGQSIFAGTRAAWIIRQPDFSVKRPEKAHEDRTDIVVTEDGYVVRAFAHPDSTAVTVMTDDELLPDRNRPEDFGMLAPLYMVEESHLINGADKIMAGWRQDLTTMVQNNYPSSQY